MMKINKVIITFISVYCLSCSPNGEVSGNPLKSIIKMNWTDKNVIINNKMLSFFIGCKLRDLVHFFKITDAQIDVIEDPVGQFSHVRINIRRKHAYLIFLQFPPEMDRLKLDERWTYDEVSVLRIRNIDVIAK